MSLSKRRSLLDLPPEVRLMIWPYLYYGSTNSWTLHMRNTRALRSLSRTCKLLHNEILAYHYTHTTLMYNSTDQLKAHLSGAGPLVRQYISHVKLDLGGENSGVAFELLAESTHLRQLWLAVSSDTAEHDGLPHAPGLELVRGAEGLDFDFKVRDVSRYLEWDRRSTQIFFDSRCGRNCRSWAPETAPLVELFDCLFSQPISEWKDTYTSSDFEKKYYRAHKIRYQDNFSEAAIAKFEKDMGAVICGPRLRVEADREVN